MQFSIVHNLTGVPILAMFLTWHHHHAISCVIHQRYQEFTNNQKSHMFPMVFQCFYVSVTRLQFGEITKTSNAVLRHDALEGAHVHENTLCVTSGALRFRPHFRNLIRCFAYAAFHMLSRTHVRRTTLRVTFGARRRSIPSGFLDRLLIPFG